jgi:hypothetical protein
MMAASPATQQAYVVWLVALLVCALVSLVAGIGADYRRNEGAVWFFAFVFVGSLGAAVVVAVMMLGRMS